MRLASLLLLAVGLWAVGLNPFTSASSRRGASRTPSADHSESLSDTIGARLLVERQGDMVRVRGAFVNDSTWTDELAYELNVRRTGGAGTTQTTQSGTFETAPGQTDTLSTVRVSVQAGDRIELHLAIRQDGTLIDKDQQQRIF